MDTLCALLLSKCIVRLDLIIYAFCVDQLHVFIFECFLQSMHFYEQLDQIIYEALNIV